MIQIKVFTGTATEIEKAFNDWAPTVPSGTQMNQAPMTREEDGRYIKEVMYVIPAVPPKIAVPTLVPPNGLQH